MTEVPHRNVDLEALTAAQHRALLEYASDVITIVDAEGKIRYQSPNSERIKGWAPETLVGENILDYVHPEDRDQVIEQFSGLVEGSGVIKETTEFRFRTKERGYIWLSVTGTAPGEEIPIDGYVTMSRDVSRRKAYEQRIREQRDDLETLNEVLRHDIRNDLQLIQGAAETLNEHVDEEGREFLATVRESADNAVSLTESAGDLAEVMLQSDGEIGSVSLDRILSEQIDALRATSPEAAVTVDDVPQVDVRAGELLASVFKNLLTNAVQHNHTAEPRIRIWAEQDDEHVRVHVADNGPGVRDELKDEIFGKGEKGLESPGTGIGLYLVRTLVESYGGSVRVEDNEPDGAVFVVELLKAE